MLKWLQHRYEQRIRHRAENDTMAEYGVSREYVQQSIAASEQLAQGKITHQDWVEKITQLSEQYPEDTAILLRATEGELV